MVGPVDFLVLGHPRSGTGYMARLLTAFGYAVGHEVVERHGVSSWMFAAYADAVPYSFDGKTRGDIAPRYVIQVVRNPLDVIASMAHTVPESAAWDFIARYVLIHRGAHPLVKAAQSVIAWNRLIQAQSPPSLTVQVEYAPQIVHGFLENIGFPPKPSDAIDLPPTNYNTRMHPRLVRSELLNELPPDLSAELILHSHEYGYEL